MKIIDVSPEYEHPYFCCLEDWSDEIKEAGGHKQQWYEQMKDKGLRVKLALDDNDVPGGMIQYIPVEYSIFEGENLYVVLCIWVHGHKQGRGNFQKRGMGRALIKAAEEDVLQRGYNGIVTWGLSIPVFMRASWFKRQGYITVGKKGIMRLMWKPFNENAVPPRFIQVRRNPEQGKEKVNISLFRNGWCTAMDIVYERTKRVAEEFKEKVELHTYDTTDRAIVEKWGITDALFIDGKEMRTGPPPKFRKIQKKVGKRVKALSHKL